MGAINDILQKMVERAAKQYIAGSHREDALELAQKFISQGIGFTIGFWDGPNDTPTEVMSQYEATAKSLVESSYLSIKLPAVKYSDKALKPIVDEAKTGRFRIHFDSLGPETVDQTWQVISALCEPALDIGCTLPGRWKRSPQDAQWAVTTQLAIRVVKGQWADPADPDRDMCAGFFEVVSQLAGRARHVAVATHDIALAEKSLRCLLDSGTHCELELLYGLPARRIMDLARDLGVSVRIYIPYGKAYLPYCLSQLKRNPQTLLRLIKDAF